MKVIIDDQDNNSEAMSEQFSVVSELKKKLHVLQLFVLAGVIGFVLSFFFPLAFYGISLKWVWVTNLVLTLNSLRLTFIDLRIQRAILVLEAEKSHACVEEIFPDKIKI